MGANWSSNVLKARRPERFKDRVVVEQNTGAKAPTRRFHRSHYRPYSIEASATGITAVLQHRDR